MRNFTAALKKSGNQVVALCLEMGVDGCGASRPKAMKSLRDAIDSYLFFIMQKMWACPIRARLLFYGCVNFCFVKSLLMCIVQHVIEYFNELSRS
jgi:hypothetical protein